MRPALKRRSHRHRDRRPSLRLCRRPSLRLCRRPSLRLCRRPSLRSRPSLRLHPRLQTRLWAPSILGLFLALCLACGGGCGDDDGSGENNSNLNENSNQNDNSNTNENTNNNENSNTNENTTPPVTSITFQEEDTVVVAEEMGHLAFPSVVRTADNRLLVVYRQGDSHVDSTGRIMKQFGDLDGTGWTAPVELYDEPNMDDRDPSVSRLSTGDLLLTYFQYTGNSHADGTVYLHEVFTARSTDNGETFGPLTQVSTGSMSYNEASIDTDGLWVDGNGDPILVTACSSPVQEWGDTLVLPVYTGNALNLSNLTNAPRSRISLYISEDDGTTWSESPLIPEVFPDFWLQEPAVLELSDGTRIAHIRSAYSSSPSSYGCLLQSVSHDGGATWSDWESKDFVGHAPDLYQLENGVLLSAFREINDQFTQEWVSFMYSLDRGETWSDPIRIEDCGAVECGYPSLVELEDGSILVVYYGAGGASIKAKVYSFTAETR